MFRRNLKILAFLAGVVIVFACAPLIAPAQSAPTFDSNSIGTAIVQTANAAGTQTALLVSPTFTSTPTALATRTPSDTPSPTVTFIFILSTPTVPSPTPKPVSSGKKLDCQILSKDPADNAHIAPNADFTVTWTVINIGTESWDSNNADYRYTSGSKIYKTGAYDFPSSVGALGQVALKVDMKAPASSGTYTTIWAIRMGDKQFCNMSITLVVP